MSREAQNGSVVEGRSVVRHEFRDQYVFNFYKSTLEEAENIRAKKRGSCFSNKLIGRNNIEDFLLRTWRPKILPQRCPPQRYSSSYFYCLL